MIETNGHKTGTTAVGQTVEAEISVGPEGAVDATFAQVDFMDLLRKVSQTWQKPLAEGTGATVGAAGQRLVR